MDFRSIKEFLKDTSIYIIIVIVVLLVVNYVTTIQQNMGPSMLPTLENGDAFILNKLAYKVGKVKRGNIIAFNYEDTKYLVKRVIGLPGEKIEFKDNILYINDKPYNEDFLPEGTITTDFTMEEIKGTIDSKIPKDMYLVLGDNRGNSMDSRGIGLINKKDIIGKTSIRIWPLNKIGIIN